MPAHHVSASSVTTTTVSDAAVQSVLLERTAASRQQQRHRQRHRSLDGASLGDEQALPRPATRSTTAEPTLEEHTSCENRPHGQDRVLHVERQLRQLKMAHSRRNPAAVVHQGSRRQHDIDISREVDHLFQQQQRPMTSSVLGMSQRSNSHRSSFFSASLPTNNSGSRINTDPSTACYTKEDPMCTQRSRAVLPPVAQRQLTPAPVASALLEEAQPEAAQAPSREAVLEVIAHQLSATEDRVKDFSFLSFDDASYQILLSSLATMHGVETLNLQYVTVPFGEETRILDVLASNPTPIVHVELYCSCFMAYPQLVEKMEAMLSQNRQRAASRAQAATAEALRKHDQARVQWLHEHSSVLFAHAKKLMVGLRDEETSEWHRVKEAWSMICAYTKQRDWDRTIFLANRAARAAMRGSECSARSAIAAREQHGFHTLVLSAWSLSRDATEGDENERRRTIWSAYCESWTRASVSTKRRQAQYNVELIALNVVALRGRHAICAEETAGRQALRVLDMAANDAMAAQRHEVRLKKDDDYRRFRQRHAEEEIALEQQRAKARMESMMHNGSPTSNGGEANEGALTKNATSMRHKPFRLGDEDVFFRFMEEVSTQLFEAMATIRKLTERCVLREGKLREALVKYQRALALPPRLWARVSADAPPTVLYDGQQHPLTIEPTLSVGLGMDSFWTVRCELLRDELLKLQQPYRQSRKECAQQLYPVMQDVDRWYRIAGLSGQLAWPGQTRAAYVANSGQPSKELFDHIERTTLQSVKRLRISKETIVCGVLRLKVPDAVQPFGGLAVDERALLAFRDVKPHLFNCSKPISMWDCAYEGLRTDIPIPEALRVDPQVMLASTLNAAITKREDLYPVETVTPLPSHRARGGGGISCPPSARTVGGAKQAEQSIVGSLTSRDDAVCATATPPVVSPAPSPQLEPVTEAEIPAITTTSPPVGSPSSLGSPLLPPTRSQFAATAIDLTIPTGVTPEQIEAFAKCIAFVPVQRVDPATGAQRGGGAITEALGAHGATLGSVSMELVLHTKGIRQRHLPPTNLAQHSQDRSSLVAPRSSSTDLGSPKASTLKGRMQSMMRRDAPVAPAAPPVPTLPSVKTAAPSTSATPDTTTADPSPPAIRRLNPLKALSIVKTEVSVVMSFLVAPSIITCSAPLHTVSHDARGGPCPLLPKELFQLRKPPAVVRYRRDPFKLKVVRHSIAKGSELLGASTTLTNASSSVSGGGGVGTTAAVSQQRGASQSLLGRPSGLHSMATAFFTPSDGDGADGPIAIGGVVDGDAPFRGLTLTVRFHQYAQTSAEDLAVVESGNVVVAKRGRVYYLPPPDGEEDDDDDVASSASASRHEERAANNSSAAAGEAGGTEEHALVPFPSVEDPFLNMTTLSKTPPTSTPLQEPGARDRSTGRDSFDDGGAEGERSPPQRCATGHHARGLSNYNCLVEQIASYEQPPQELRVSFLSDEYVTMARVEKTLRAIAYRNASVDPTTGPRKMTVTIASPAAGVSESLEVVVNVTAMDDPTDWAVHNAHRVVHFPLDAAHARAWIASFESTEGLSHAEAVAMVDRLVPPAVLRFADAVEVLDDDTTFFSAGHLRFALFEGRDDVPLGGRPTASLDATGDDDTFVLDNTMSQSGFGKLSDVGSPCQDDGVGLFLDVPLYRTLFGLCLVARDGAAATRSCTDPTGGVPAVYDLFDDGYLQGSVRMGATHFGTVTRRYAAQPAPPDAAAAGHHSTAIQQLDSLVALADIGEGFQHPTAESPHATSTCTHVLVNTIHVDFAKGGNGATVDAVQELLKLVSYVNLKRFPTASSDTATRLATIDMLVGATTGRRDILGELLEDSNVNHPLHAVVAIEPRASFLKPTPNDCSPLAPRHYPENSGQMFLFDEAFSIPHSFVGGYLKVELVEGFAESLDRVDCVDRTEAIAFQERERDDHRRKMASGRKCCGGGGGGADDSSYDSNSASSSFRPGGGGTGEITLSFDMPQANAGTAAAAMVGGLGHAPTTIGTTPGQPASMLSAPSAYAAINPGTRYGAVRLVQNPIVERFGADTVAVARAAHVSPSLRNLAAYTMREFAKVNMLSSSAETVAARNTSADIVSPPSSMKCSASQRKSLLGMESTTDLFAGSATVAPHSAMGNVSPPPASTAAVEENLSPRSRSSSLQPGSCRPSHQPLATLLSSSTSTPPPMACTFLPTNANFFQSIALAEHPATLFGGVSDHSGVDGSRHGSLSIANGSPLGGTRRRRRSSAVAIAAPGDPEASSPIAGASVRSEDDEALCDDSDDGSPIADALALAEATGEEEAAPIVHHRQRRGSHRSRSVVFQRDSLLESAHARFDDTELLGRSVVNPVLHATLLAASTRRRSSMVHQQQLRRTGSQYASTLNIRRQSDSRAISGGGKSSGTKRRSISSIGRSAQELVWANRLKKILMERSDSFMFLLKKSCARLIADRLEHLEYLGVDERFVACNNAFITPAAYPAATATPATMFAEPAVSVHALLPNTVSATTSHNPDEVPPAVSMSGEIATTFCLRAAGALVVIFEPTTVITPSTLAAITRTIGFESRSRCTIQPLRILRLTLRMYEEGAASLLVPLRVVPYDDPAEVTLRMPCLRWRHCCTAITPIVRQFMGKGTGGGASLKAPGKAAKGGKGTAAVTAIATQSAVAMAMQQQHHGGGGVPPPLCKDGIGAIRLFPKESSSILDVDTTYWDAGAVEVTITHGGTRGDCLCLLTVEQQRTMRRIIGHAADNSSVGGGGVTSRQSVSARGGAPGATPPRTPNINLPIVASPPSGHLELAGGLSTASMALLSARSPGRMDASATSHGAMSTTTAPPGGDDPTTEWLLAAEPPFPTPSFTHIDPSQHALMEANESVHSAVLQQPRQLSVVRASDGVVLLHNIGTVTVERAMQPDVGSTAIDLERSKLAASMSVGGGSDVTPRPVGGGNVVTMLRVEFAAPPDDDPYAYRVTLDVLRLVVHNIGFFNVVPLEAERVVKTATIAIHDALSPEPPARQTVSIECLPSYFFKPSLLCEPALYTQRAAIEGRFEFVLQRLKTTSCLNDRDRMPLCTMEVLPVSGWLPRDTLMLRFSGSPYVLTQDGQVICGKELVCKHTVATANGIRTEITKECKGATWPKVAGLLALVSYHFDMKDFGKDAPAPPPQQAQQQGGASAAGSQQVAAAVPASSPNTVPSHDRMIALQISEPGVRDAEGRLEQWCLLQRISYTSGISSDQ